MDQPPPPPPDDHQQGNAAGKPRADVNEPGTLVHPNDFDIILGRGVLHAGHPGNIRFYAVIDQYIPIYNSAKTRTDKTRVVQNIYDTLTSLGRFVKEDRPSAACVVVDIDAAKKKISHAIRYRRQQGEGGAPSPQQQGQKKRARSETPPSTSKKAAASPATVQRALAPAFGARTSYEPSLQTFSQPQIVAHPQPLQQPSPQLQQPQIGHHHQQALHLQHQQALHEQRRQLLLLQQQHQLLLRHQQQVQQQQSLSQQRQPQLIQQQEQQQQRRRPPEESKNPPANVLHQQQRIQPGLARQQGQTTPPAASLLPYNAPSVGTGSSPESIFGDGELESVLLPPEEMESAPSAHEAFLMESETKDDSEDTNGSHYE